MTPFKRAFDVALALSGLMVAWPLFLIIAIAIKLQDRGPVFFRQERVGRFGIPFRIWKFRTMVTDAPKLGAPLTIGRDPRITQVGAVLRKYKLDELPQLLNVLDGTMSFVGPRPEVPVYVALYSDEQRRVLDLAPGITDLASIKFRNEGEILSAAEDPEMVYRERIMPEKISINLEYAANRSARSDIQVILKTIFKLGLPDKT